jgi:hypothetical protein
LGKYAKDFGIFLNNISPYFFYIFRDNKIFRIVDSSFLRSISPSPDDDDVPIPDPPPSVRVAGSRVSSWGSRFRPEGSGRIRRDLDELIAPDGRDDDGHEFDQ